MDYSRRILIVDDDEGIRQLMGEFLEKHGYRVEAAADPIEMRQRLAEAAFDLIVLDVMMPREDGLTALRKLGSHAPPVIMLSAVGNDVDRIVGLELGADDYLAKPCNPRELLARVRTVLRRKEGRGEIGPEGGSEVIAFPVAPPEVPPGDRVLRFLGWRLDLDMRLLFDPANRLIALSDGEFRLLQAFAEHPRRVLTRDQLLEWSRGENTENFDRAIDVQLSRLRRKLADSVSDGPDELIRTVRNEGYLFVPPVERG